MAVQGIREIPVETQAVNQHEAALRYPEPPKPIAKTVSDNALLAAFEAISRVLAIRFFLFLSLIGTFSLALVAIEDKTPQSLSVMIAYSFLTTGFLSILEWKGRKNGQ